MIKGFAMGQAFRAMLPRLRLCAFALWMCLCGAVQAQVTVQSLTLPSNIGRGQDVSVEISWLRTSSAAATISTPLPAQVQVAPPALAAGCSLNGVSVDCTVPAGAAGSTGTITFQVRGAALGGFNLTGTATGGSNASGSSNVTSAGDLTVVKNKTSPAGNPITGESTVFGLTPNLALADDVPGSATLVVTDNLPGTSTDFNLTAIGNTGPLTPTCTSVAAANASRTFTCSYNGPFTVADFNASAITLTGTPGNTGNFTNVASVASGNVNYFDSNSTNNIANFPYTVGTGSDIQAQASFPAGGVLTGSAQNLTLTYRNNGPLNVPAGGTVAVDIPSGFVLGALPAGCTSAGAGPFTVTCTAGAVNSRSTQSFVVALTMPGTATAGNFPIAATPPAGFGDAVPGNNSVNVPFSVVDPFADLRAAKTKTPGGPQPPGTVVTTTLTVTNDASSPADAAFSPAQPLRLVDHLKPEEVSGAAVSAVSANWNCTVTAGVVPPAFVNAALTTRVACQSTDTGTLAIGANRSVSFSSTLNLGGSTTPIALPDTVCTGSHALAALGLVDANGPQPADGGRTGNDCANDSVNLVLTPVVSGSAQASVQKQASVNNVAFFDPVGSGPTLAADASPLFWRMVITTPTLGVNAGQTTIPTLRLQDTLPGRLDVTSTGSPAPGYVTPAITVTTTPTTFGVCPNLNAGNAGSLACDFTNVPAGTTITVDLAVARPLASGALDNTATLSSPDAVLSASTGGQLSDAARVVVTPVLDIALTTKTVTPATPRIGELVQFTITAQNLGPDDITSAGQFTITDTLNVTPGASVGYEVLSVSGSGMDCTASNLATGAVSCTNTGAIARYVVRTITISARIKKPGGALPPTGNVYTNQTNTAAVVLGGGICEFKTETVTNGLLSTTCNDANSTSNNSKIATFDVLVPAIDMKQRKERVLPGGQTAFALGDPLRYRFRVQANGPSRAESVSMTDRLTVPGGINVEMDGAGGFPRTVTPLVINAAAPEAGYTVDATKAASVRCTQTAANGDVVCQLSSVTADNFLDAAKEVNFELVFNLTPTSSSVPVTIGNRAFACADETAAYESSGACSDAPGTAGNNLASVNDTVFPKNDLEVVSKATVTASPADINQPIRYNIVMRNNGSSAAVKLRLKDTLPTGFEWINTGANAPVVTVDGGSAATLAGALAVSGTVPANGTANVCFVSNAITSVTTLVQQQEITCDISGTFPAGAANTVTLALFARAKGGLYDGSGAAPYAVNRTNSASIFPGQDATGTDIAIDLVSGNNSKTSTIQVRTAQVAGRSFVDLNGNGDQNGTISGQDQGIGNVTLSLTGTDLYGFPITRTVTTDNAAAGAGSTRGDYLFANLPPSNAAGYTITQNQPVGFANGTAQPNTARPVRNASSTGISGPITVSNTVGPDTSVIAGVQLAGGGNGVQFDFPEGQRPAISGFVYLNDANNGTKAGGEAGLNGVALTLVGCGAGANGTLETAGPIGAGPAVCNGDDVAVNLSATTSTDGVLGAGFYRFQLEQPGRYSVIQQASQPVANGAVTLRGQTTAGSVDLVTSAVGANDGGTRGTVNTTANTIGGSASVLQEFAGTVAASQIRDIVINNSAAVSVNNNFGELQPASVSGVVYTERGSLNSNFASGIDWGFPGVTLTLTGTDDLGRAVTLATSTDAAGNYSFGNLRPGTYQVVKTNPAGITNEVGGAFPGVDAGNTARGARVDDNTVNSIALLSARVVGNTNFAVTNGPAPALPGINVTGLVYLDRNRNEELDANDIRRIAGVTLRLVQGTSCESGTVLQSTTSSGNGQYTFAGLTAGANYLVCQTQPAGYGVGNAKGVSGSNVIVINNLGPAGSSDNNFGETLGLIDGTVWLDANDNGVRDAGEPAIAGVGLTLSGLDINGNVVTLTVATDADGHYLFEDLFASGAAGFTVTQQAAQPNVPGTSNPTRNGKTVVGSVNGSALGLATQADVVPSRVSAILLPGGALSQGNNFGELPSGIISGVVYVDRERNHALDPADNGRVAGVTVRLVQGASCEAGTLLQTTTTDAQGQYSFGNLATGGNYLVCQTQPAAYGNGNAKGIPGSNSISINNLAATGSIGNDFGEWLGSIDGYVWLDANNDGVRDVLEPGLAGVSIRLGGVDTNGAGVNRIATTDANGFYRFDDLLASGAAGYSLTEQTAQPLVPGTSQPTFNGQTVAGSVGVVATGRASAATVVPSTITNIVLPVAGVSTNNSFGEIPTGLISGLVYVDRERNHGLDPTDTARIPGVTIRLVQGPNCDSGTVLQTTTTNAVGEYSFSKVTTGSTYLVCQTQPDGFGNGNAMGVPGSNVITIANLPSSGSSNNHFGEWLGSIDGHVWLDGNDNGQRESGEPGIADVRVTLTGIGANGAPVSRTANTNASGYYRFDDLPASDANGYTVTEQIAQPIAPGTTKSTVNGQTVAGTIDGKTTGLGTAISTLPSAVTGIVLPAGSTSVNNNFGEIANSVPDLVVNKSISKAVLTEGNLATYTVRVRNVGQSPTEGRYTVTDRLPATGGTPSSWALESATGNGWTCVIAVDKLSLACTAGAVLSPGAESSPIILGVRIGAGAAAFSPLRNLVLVGGGGEPDSRAPSTDDLNRPQPCTATPQRNACQTTNEVQRASGLNGHVWIDGGTKKVLDSADKVLPQWIVELYDVNDPVANGKSFTDLVRGGLARRTALTDAQGYYEFCDLEPGTVYRLLFRDPANRIAFTGVVTNEKGANTDAAYFSQVKEREGFQVLEVKLPAGAGGPGCGSVGVTAPEQSLPLDPNGVVYDSLTRQPVPGAKVTFEPVGICPGYDPRLHIINYETYSKDALGNPGVTVGSDGFYKFLLSGDPTAPKSCQFHLRVDEPIGYKPPPSTVIPAQPALRTPPSPGIVEVQPQKPPPTGSQSTAYHFDVLVGLAHREIFNNHIPLDPLIPGKLVLTKQGDKRIVQVGDVVLYTIQVRLLAGDPVAQATVLDRLPAGLTYILGTARVNNRAITDPLGGRGPRLAFNVGALKADSQVQLTYRVRVGVGAVQGNGINIAQAYGCQIPGGCVEPGALLPKPGSVPSNAAQHRVDVTGGVFTAEACVLGKVFVDCNHNHVQDAEELGIPGVRLYFEDGRHVVTDSEGKYNRCGLQPKSHVLAPDASTLPQGARLTTSSNRNLGDPRSLFIDLKNGELHRADFIEGSCSNRVLEQVRARRAQGEVRSVETERRAGPMLQFRSQPPGAPPQATNSANQPLVQPRQGDGNAR